MATIGDGRLCERLCGDGQTASTQRTLAGTDAHHRPATKGFGSIGYRAHWRILNAADYGVPQTRRRVFVVAIREGLPSPPDGQQFPEPTHRKSEWVPVREAIGDLCAVPEDAAMTDQLNEAHQRAGRRPMSSVADPAGTIRTGTPPKVEVESDLEPDGGRITHPSTTQLPNHDPIDHGDATRETADVCPVGNPGSSGQADLPAAVAAEPSCTISASRPYLLERGHAEYIADRSVRRLTVRECARIQSFPDWFEFSGSKTEQYRQVGNAVPPTLAYHIAEHLRTLLANMEDE
jgi:DNA (cytosine-5)-methyltransferase 1